MRYLSTRGGMDPQAFCDILIGGLAPDGGLVVPAQYPAVDATTLADWRGLDYAGLATAIIGRYVDDLPSATLAELIGRAYTPELFGSAEITPVRPLMPGVHILGLSNGPTLAFKDIAMQLLGQLFSHVLAERDATLNILGATSGDTGSSAEYAMRGKPNIKVFMLSPHGKTSPFQAAQMYALHEPNIFNIAVRGVFDDCQDIVKALNEDAEFKARYRIGAVNSINWGRVVAQIVYYFKAYFAVTEHNDQPLDMVVPSGNFGNIYAGHIARSMGLPIRRLILATNENDVLDEFFRTGVYRVRPSNEVHQTSSPSMDISKASNFERFVFDLVGRDPDVVRDLWRQVREQGGFDLRATPYRADMERYGFVSGSSTHADRMRTIREVYQRYGEIVDTHTADGIKVGLEYHDPAVPLICQETALPVKFEASIEQALGFRPPRPRGYEGLENLPQRFEVLPPEARTIRDFIVRSLEHGVPE